MKRLEWRLTVAFFVILAVFIAISKISVYRSSQILARHSQRKTPDLISVAVEGAVVKPGIYEIKPGTTMRKILGKAKPKPSANLRKFDLNSSLFVPTTLLIEELDAIVVRIFYEGKLIQEITTAPTSRVADLKSKIQLPEDADRTPLLSKRMLKDGDILNFSQTACRK